MASSSMIQIMRDIVSKSMNEPQEYTTDIPSAISKVDSWLTDMQFPVVNTIVELHSKDGEVFQKSGMDFLSAFWECVDHFTRNVSTITIDNSEYIVDFSQLLSYINNISEVHLIVPLTTYVWISHYNQPMLYYLYENSTNPYLFRNKETGDIEVVIVDTSIVYARSNWVGSLRQCVRHDSLIDESTFKDLCELVTYEETGIPPENDKYVVCTIYEDGSISVDDDKDDNEQMYVSNGFEPLFPVQIGTYKELHSPHTNTHTIKAHEINKKVWKSTCRRCKLNNEISFSVLTSIKEVPCILNCVKCNNGVTTIKCCDRCNNKYFSSNNDVFNKCPKCK